MIATGTKLGPYEISAQLGAGGMGEVYRARDTRLDRTVAIKILASHLSSSPELKQRLEREARTVSSLNHAHICQLFDVGSQDGTDFLVMEFLEGETLAERLRKGALSLNELLKIGTEIAEALEVAHRAGIIHRDLKPGNIMLTKSGAKLMDFGLAKPSALGAAASGSAPLLSAARTASGPSPMSPLTTAGSIVGTIQYMSPEQIEGKEADARSDIFAFGAVLYEMATGKRAFEGKSQISVASAILEKDPEPISTIKPLTPPQFEHVVRRALEKAPDDRWQTASDIRGELKWVAESPSQTLAAPASIASARRSVWPALGVAAIIILSAVVFFLFRPRQESGVSGVMQAEIPAPPGTSFVLTNDDTSGPAVISADAAALSFVATDDKGARQIWVRRLSASEATPVPGTEGATYPFWSPDGKTIGFFSNGKMRTVPAGGGPVLALADVVRARGGSWGKNGMILFTPDIETGVFEIPAIGGMPKQLTKPIAGVNTTNRWPVWLPDDQHFLYLATNHGNPNASQQNGIFVASIDGKENRLLMPADSNAVLAPGHVMTIQNGVLMVQPFDEARAKLTGDPVPLVQGVQRNNGTWRGAFDASSNGVLVYQSGTSGAKSQLLWYAPDGKTPKTIGDAGDYYELRLSHDGKRLVVAMGDPSRDLWMYDMARGIGTRFTFSYNGSTSAWSPDGTRVAFSGRYGDKPGIFEKSSSGSGEPLFLEQTGQIPNVVSDWSPDGKYLAFVAVSSSGNSEVWILPMTGEHKPQKFSPGTDFNVFDGKFSPDRKWMVYTSDETGKDEVYITSFPTASGKWQVSVGGGTEGHWRRDGKAIIYRGAEGNLMEAPVTLGANSVQIGAVRTYINATPEPNFLGGTWDLAPDGHAIVVNRFTNNASTVNLFLNWTSELELKK